MSLPQVDGVAFRLVVGHDGYAVGDDGTVWSCRQSRGAHPSIIGTKWKKLTPHLTRYGYRKLPLWPGRRLRFVHHLVLEAFVGPRPAGTETCHYDGNRTNNALSNLRWDTPKSNAADRERHSNYTRRARPEITKYSDDVIRAIRAERVATGMSYMKLSAKYKVSFAHVAAICRGEHRKHVK